MQRPRRLIALKTARERTRILKNHCIISILYLGMSALHPRRQEHKHVDPLYRSSLRRLMQNASARRETRKKNADLEEDAFPEHLSLIVSLTLILLKTRATCCVTSQRTSLYTHTHTHTHIHRACGPSKGFLFFAWAWVVCDDEEALCRLASDYARVLCNVD